MLLRRRKNERCSEAGPCARPRLVPEVTARRVPRHRSRADCGLEGVPPTRDPYGDCSNRRNDRGGNQTNQDRVLDERGAVLFAHQAASQLLHFRHANTHFQTLVVETRHLHQIGTMQV